MSDTQGHSYAFLNFFKIALNAKQATSPYNYPVDFDDNGYPNKALSQSMSSTFSIPPPTGSGPAGTYTPNFVIKQRNGVTGAWKCVVDCSNQAGAAFTSVTATSGSISGVSSTQFTISGTNPRVTFSMTGLASHSGNSMLLSWPTSGTFSGTPDIAWLRADQESLYDAGQIWNPDHIAQVRALNVNTIRLMDWGQTNNSYASQFVDRAPAGSFNFLDFRWSSTARSPATITNVGNAFTATIPTNWNGVVEGATIQGQLGTSIGFTPKTVTAVSASTTPYWLASQGFWQSCACTGHGLSTGNRIAYRGGNQSGIWTVTVVDANNFLLNDSIFVNSGDTGTFSQLTLTVGGVTKPMMFQSGGVAFLFDSDLVNLVFDSVLDAWLIHIGNTGASPNYGAGGQMPGIPIELLVDYANTLNVNLWYCIPWRYNDASVTAVANYIKANLKPGLVCHYELSNEVWNVFSFDQAAANNMRGYCGMLWFGSNEASAAFHGLRFRIISGLIKTAYAGQSNYKMNFMWQAQDTNFQFGYTGQHTSFPTVGNLFTVSGGSGRGAYNTYTGSTAYSSPIDWPGNWADVVGYATYYYGPQLCDVNDGANYYSGQNVTTGGPLGWTTGLVGAADAFAAGGATNIANAFAFLDWDIDVNTATSSVWGAASNLATYRTSIYPAWETFINTHLDDTTRAGFGKAPLQVMNYEGGYSAIAPQLVNDVTGLNDCTVLGISNVYGNEGGLINTMVVAYKQSPNFKAIVTKQYADFMASGPHAKRPCWFAWAGPYNGQLAGGQWSMKNGTIYDAPDFQSFQATADFNQ